MLFVIAAGATSSLLVIAAGATSALPVITAGAASALLVIAARTAAGAASALSAFEDLDVHVAVGLNAAPHRSFFIAAAARLSLALRRPAFGRSLVTIGKARCLSNVAVARRTGSDLIIDADLATSAPSMSFLSAGFTTTGLVSLTFSSACFRSLVTVRQSRCLSNMAVAAGACACSIFHTPLVFRAKSHARPDFFSGSRLRNGALFAGLLPKYRNGS